MNAATRTWIQQQRSKRDARYASKLQDERFDALRRRPVRRGLVLASFLLLLGAVLMVWYADTAGVDPGLHLGYLAVGLLAAGALALVRFAVRVHWPQRALDERLVAVRDAAYRTAFRIVGVAGGLTLFGLSLAWEAESVSFTLEPHHLRALLLAFVGAVVMTPGAVLAWREREV